MENKRNLQICYPFPEEWGPYYPKAVVMFRFLVYYTIPLTIIGIFYALIAVHLIHSVNNVPGEMQGANRQIRARKKVAVTVLAFVVAFALCFLPYHIFMLWFYFDPNSEKNYNSFWHTLRILGFCLSFLNSCINPVALYCVSGAFRKHFKRYLLCRGRFSVRHRCRTTTTCRGRDNSVSLTASRVLTTHQQSISIQNNGESMRRCPSQLPHSGHHKSILNGSDGIDTTKQPPFGIAKRSFLHKLSDCNRHHHHHHHHCQHYHHKDGIKGETTTEVIEVQPASPLVLKHQENVMTSSF